MPALQTHAQQLGAHGVAAVPEAACDLPSTVAVDPEFFEECNAGGIPHGVLSYTQSASADNIATLGSRSAPSTGQPPMQIVDLPFDVRASLTASSWTSRAVIAEDPNAGQRFESKQRGKPW